jgi:hypothetical protein
LGKVFVFMKAQSLTRSSVYLLNFVHHSFFLWHAVWRILPLLAAWEDLTGCLFSWLETWKIRRFIWNWKLFGYGWSWKLSMYT